jgi:predicted CxxxxCH...CXXCH cytochrome family protein
MSAIRYRIILPIFFTMVIFGCGKVNDRAPALLANSTHPADWQIKHRAAFRQNRDQCRECHGMDLKGGITAIGCFNQARLGECHADGHGPRIAPHQSPFNDGAVHGPVAKADLVFCQSCHGTSAGPGGNPRFNLPIGSLVHGCEDCHLPKTAHPVHQGTSGWNGHVRAGNQGNSCILCHGLDLTGGNGPGCNTCHTALNPGSIPAFGSCVSCHAASPATGNHTVHNTLPGVATVCSTCHDGAGYGTPKHRNGTTDVAFAIAYNAKSGVAARINGSCLNISCHGGVATPSWGRVLTGGCLSCHTAGTASGVPQYNSYYSGQHSMHLNVVGLQCVDCHNMTVTVAGAGHFTGLKTTAFELAPATTVRVPGYPSCNPGVNPAIGKYSIGLCHSSRAW